MIIWKQTSLFADLEEQALEKIIPSLRPFGEFTPYSLVKNGLKKYSKTGDLVLDPCCGNGTTGIAALEMNRKAVLSDINLIATRTTRNLFSFFDYNRVMILWSKIRDEPLNPTRQEEERWERFINSPIPPFKSFKRIINKNIIEIKQIFHEYDLNVLKRIYLGILRIKDQSSRELLEIVFHNTLFEVSQLEISKNRRSFYLPKHIKTRDPIKLFQKKLKLYLNYKSLLREKLARNFVWTPIVRQASVYNLNFLKAESIDYVILHLPGLRGYREGEMSYLSELLIGEFTNYDDEICIELDYRGRYKLARNLKKLLKEMERVMKDSSYLTLIITGHHVLLSLIIKLAQDEGWHLVQEGVEMVTGQQKENYPVISLTLQKKKQNTVLGSLNKMKIETLYNIEEAIIRKIDQYLSKKGTATTGEIQRYLLENFLHDCLIEKSLEDLLKENYLYSGKYWLKPSSGQEEKLYKKRQQKMEKVFDKFVREMVYYFLQEEKNALSYRELMERFLKIKPRTIFHTPYYRLLMEQCERQQIKLNMLIKEYFQKEKKDQFETLPMILRRIIRADKIFVEVVKGELVGLSEWSRDNFFKIYLELYEKSRREKDQDSLQKFGKKVLELLDEITYLTERKKERIRDYIMRSEGL
ncbi:hypothetical protein BBF96_04845 [Anoxybacter fermentans]|uniref:DNA methylase N-4/N-6 domain-containing protein n=1 Tax=Anoxybacter fermentans TaxID=1323375 RepID=A0A3S9SWU6_9FIRM|nr:DNA methyltransferase [Anoxybacter fermentans]AZR72779.1 hypothetical protein BBF96_04845 [Anoxybacter fermentans]